METVIVSKEELQALGINPESPMSSARTRTNYIDVRYGDDRIQRTRQGVITHYFGYYSEHQVLARRLMGEAINREFMKHSLWRRLCIAKN